MEEVTGVGAPPDRRWTIQRVIIWAWVVLMAAVIILGLPANDRGKPRPFDLLGAFFSAIAHASWITLDCQRHGRPVGPWRWGAILIGPLAIWMYLAVAYGRRSLYLIPISVLVYAAPILIVLGFSAIFHR